jgi:hypothetical protein
MSMLGIPILPQDAGAVIFILALFAGTVLTVVPCVIACQVRKTREAQLNAALKRDMVDRGMSAEEIERVLGVVQPQPPKGIDFPLASEVVVEWEGDWYPALALKRDGDRYYVHFVGHSMEENDWVPLERMRFPAGTMPRREAHAEAAAPVNGIPPRKQPGVGLDL